MSAASNRGRGVAAAAAFLCSVVGMSAVFVGSFSIMLPVVGKALGIGVTSFALVFTVVQYVTAVGAPFGGRLIDKVGARVPASIGIATSAIGLVVLSQGQAHGPGIWIGGALVGVGAAIGGPIAYVPVISSWFSVHRALALALVLTISPQIGQAIVAPVTRWLIDTYDWRTTYLVLAAAVVVLGVVPASLFLRPRPRERDIAPDAKLPPADITAVNAAAAPVGASEDGMRSRQVYASRIYWTLTAADCLAIAAIVGTQTNLVNWLGGDRGVSVQITTLLLSTLSIAGIFGVIGVGYIADKVRRSQVLIPLYALSPLGIVLLIVSGRSTVGLIVGVVFLGAGMTAVQMLLPYLITRYFGFRATSEIYGVSLAANVLSIGTGPLLLSWAFEVTGSYTVPMICAAGATIVAAALIATMGPYRFAVAPKEESIEEPVEAGVPQS